MKKFARLFVRFWIISIPCLLILLNIFNGNWAAVFGILAGWIYGRDFNRDFALLKDNYQDFRNSSGKENYESRNVSDDS